MNIQKTRFRKSFWLALVFSPFLLLQTGCGKGGSDVGSQADADPQAATTVINFSDQINASLVSVRSGSQIVVTAKDSDGLDDPILELNWSVEMIGSSKTIAFTQNSKSSIAFMAPSEDVLAGLSDLKVRLTVIDADGKESTREIVLNVKPVKDTNHYLVHNASGVEVGEYFYVHIKNLSDLVETFNLSITPQVRWQSVDGEDHAREGSPELLDEDPFNNTFSFAPITALTLEPNQNYVLKLPIPLIDSDEINSLPSVAFEQRLELEQIDTASMHLGFDFSATANLSLSVTDADGTVLLDSTGAPLLSVTGNAQETVAIDGANFDKTPIDGLRSALGLESVASAKAYYDCIDPEAISLDPSTQTATLARWLSHPESGVNGAIDRGFGPARSQLSEENFAHAVYVNNYDLGFGRDMYMRETETGDVYSYVINHPTLQATVEGTAAFAVVAMDYSSSPGCTENPEDKIVKFYAYVPDTVNGGFKRAKTMNFDGRGERPVPGACTSCHGGSIKDIQGLIAGTDLNAADLDATFMPWDLESFLYTSSSTELADPTYNSRDLSRSVTDAYTRSTQEYAFKKLNQMALNTYLHEVNVEGEPLARYAAPIALITGWYGTENCDPTLSTENCEALPGEFNRDYMQPGWDLGGEIETLYKAVYERNCRMCHTQLERDELNFDSYEEFVGGAFEGERVERMHELVFQQGRMPMARLTADRFWLDVVAEGGQTAADLLSNHLFNQFGQEPAVPGDPVAELAISPADNAGALIPNLTSTMQMSGIESLFAESYQWEIYDAANLLLATGSGSTFDFEPTSPGDYTASLVVTNTEGKVSAPAQEAFTVYNRLPTFITDLDATAEIPGDYSAGDDLVIDLGSMIGDEGDGPVTLAITEDFSDTKAFLNIADLNVGRTVTLEPFSASSVIDGAFTFSITDTTGDSLEKTVTASIDPTSYDDEPPTAPTGLSVSKNISNPQSVTFSWGASTDNIGIASYRVRVYRGVSKIQDFTVSGTSTPINSLSPRTTYRFEVSATDTAIPPNSSAFVSTTATTYTSYATNVFPILSAKRSGCTGCHGSSGGFTFYSNSISLHSELTGVFDGDSRVSVSNCGSTPVPGADNIVKCANDGCGTMSDASGSDFSSTQTTILLDWMCQGAPLN